MMILTRIEQLKLIVLVIMIILVPVMIIPIVVIVVIVLILAADAVPGPAGRTTGLLTSVGTPVLAAIGTSCSWLIVIDE